MRKRSWKRLWKLGAATVFFAAAFFALARPARADLDFQVKRMTRTDVPAGKGQCDIRLQVDGEVEVTFRADRVRVHTISGRDARDDGSECNQPMPTRSFAGFNFEVLDKRNQINLTAGPDRPTGYGAVVRIRDDDNGYGRYHFRVSWQLGSAESGPGSGRDGGGSGPGYSRYGDHGPDYRPNTPPSPAARAINACSDAVRDRINRDYHFANVDIQNPKADDRPGRKDWIMGDATGHRDRNAGYFSFSCQADFSTGQVHSVYVKRR
jgi:hypothetical protein